MKNFFLITSIIIFLAQCSNAQLYEMESSKNTDLSSKNSKMEKVFFTIDSLHMSLKSGERTYYYDATSFSMTDGIINMIALDLNDEEVMIKFSPQAKVLDYYIKEFGIRYFLDKVELPKPETEETDTVKIDSVLSEEELTRLDTMVYEQADEMPEYPGGKTEMLNYFSKNVKYPSGAKKSNIKGFVLANAIIEKDGTIKYVKVRKDIGGGCGEETIRVIKSMPPWTPGELKGETVRVSVPITVSFMPK